MTNESCWLQFHDIVMHAANSIHHKHYEEAEVEQPATDNLNGQTA